jgi:hypothetical protein
VHRLDLVGRAGRGDRVHEAEVRASIHRHEAGETREPATRGTVAGCAPL